VSAGRGLEFRQPLEPAAGTGAALAALRDARVAGAGPDRWLAPDLAQAEELVTSGRLVAAVEAVTGPLD
jgi:histidine ammonia-lyase